MNIRAKLLLLVPLVVVAWLFVTFLDRPWTIARVVGLVLLVAGTGLLSWARLSLGDAFSVKPRAKRLVTTGPYARIRHPVYVFSALGFIGLALYVELEWLLVSLVVLLPVQLWRARREEHVLEEAFGDEYRRHRARTWF